MRMLMNNLDPEVAERPQDLVVYGGTGKAARNWEAYDAIVACLTDLGDDETLLVQSGKPVGGLPHPRDGAARADRELDARAEVGGLGDVPRARTRGAHDVRPDDGRLVDLHRHAGDPAGDLRDARRVRRPTLRRHARRHRHADRRAGRHGRRAAPRRHDERRRRALCVEVDPARIERRIKTRYLDRETDSLEDALEWVERAKAEREAVSIGLLGNCADVVPELVRRGWTPEVVTDQTSAHDPLGGYVPAGVSLEEAARLREQDPDAYVAAAQRSMAAHVDAIVTLQERGAVAFDYGNNLRAGAELGGLAHDRAYAYPGFVPAFVRPLFCEGKGPFRWAALSGDPADIAATDRAVAELFPDDERLHRWLTMAADRVAFQGLPARICWLGYGERARAGLRFNELVASGEVSAPIVIGRDHLDAGSVASPFRETEAMADGSDAIADWPILNALINTAAGAHWVSVHHGGGVGIGYSIHAGMVVVADGTEAARERLERVLDDRPGDGRRAARRRRLRPRARGRARPRRSHPDGSGPVTERHIVAMGGGGFSMDDPVLDAYVLGLVGASRPKVCFLPTATSSVPTYVTRFFEAFPASSFEPTFLDLFDRSVSRPRGPARRAGRDLRRRRQHREPAGGVARARARRALRAAWEAGVVLCGQSAGANCWFEASTTDSFLVGHADALRRRAGAPAGQLLPALRRRARAASFVPRVSSPTARCRRASRATTSPPCTSPAPSCAKRSPRRRAPARIASRPARALRSRSRCRPACSRPRSPPAASSPRSSPRRGRRSRPRPRS